MLLEFDDEPSDVSLKNLPSNVRVQELTNLLKMSERIYPEVNDILGSVEDFLKSLNVTWTGGWDQTLPLGVLIVTSNERTIKLCLVSDYAKFNVKSLPPKFIEKYQQELLKDGNRVLWIKRFEWEDLRKQNVLKSLITHALGLTNKKIPARKTYAELIPNSELRNFFNLSSFYGFRGASDAACLRDSATGEVLMAMSFGHPYYGKNKYPDGTIECIRAATTPFTSVQGGMTKLMKFIVESLDPTAILYYVDDAHYDSKSMSALGFKYSHLSTGASHNVFVKSGSMFMRRPSSHQEVMYLMKLGEVVAVPDVGNSVYLWTKS